MKSSVNIQSDSIDATNNRFQSNGKSGIIELRKLTRSNIVVHVHDFQRCGRHVST